MTLPFAAALFGTRQNAVFVALATGFATQNTVNTVTLPTGTHTGDYVFIFCEEDNATVTMAGTSTGAWTQEFVNGGGNNCVAVHKKLRDLGTITLNPGATGAGRYVVVSFRNVSAASAVFNGVGAPNVGGTMTQTGYTKGASCIGIVSFVGDHNADGSQTFSISSPAGFTVGGQSVDASSGAGEAHNLNPTTYTNGTNIVWSGLVTSGAGGATYNGLIFELT